MRTHCADGSYLRFSARSRHSASDPIADKAQESHNLSMTIPFLSAPLLMMVSATAPGSDQTNDARLVLEFVQAAKRGDLDEVLSMLLPDAFIGDYTQKERSSFNEFADYFRACPFLRVSTFPVEGRRMPVGATWKCRGQGGERHASFWFEGDRISRIGWGQPVVIKIPATTPR